MSWVATAVVGGTVVSGYMQKEAAGGAAAATRAGAEMSTAEIRRQFDRMQELFAPYIEAGETSLTAQMGLIGLGGPEAEQQAIQRIMGGPTYQAMVGQGEEAILQQAAATGGVRGGNVQAALAQFRPEMLSRLIESQYAKLGGVTQLGQASAAGVGAGGMQAAGGIADIYGRAAESQAGAALATGRAQAQMFGDIAGAGVYLAGRQTPGFAVGGGQVPGDAYGPAMDYYRRGTF